MRARFHNPNFLCSFNSLTQCLYNLKDFRDLVLSYNPDDNIPVALTIDPTTAVGSVSSSLKNVEKGVQFVKEYIKIFKSMKDPTLVLDLRSCVANFEDGNGKPFLQTGPADPFLEFLAIMRNFSLKDRPFMCRMVMPMMNPFTKLFMHISSLNFQKPARSLHLHVPISPLFGFPIAETYYDFRKEDNPPDKRVLHSLPDILCVHVEDLEKHKDEKIHFTVDFNHFVFDDTKDYTYKLNSFIMMLNSVHAVAYVRANAGNEQWIVCNDSEQRTITKEQLHHELAICGPAHRAIVVFYERIK